VERASRCRHPIGGVGAIPTAAATVLSLGSRRGQGIGRLHAADEVPREYLSVRTSRKVESRKSPGARDHRGGCNGGSTAMAEEAVHSATISWGDKMIGGTQVSHAGEKGERGTQADAQTKETVDRAGPRSSERVRNE
jgi:hypothetical protein